MKRIKVLIVIAVRSMAIQAAFSQTGRTTTASPVISNAPCNFTLDIKANTPATQCYDNNKVCFSMPYRPNAYYWVWTFDDPVSMQNNTDDMNRNPCHNYTSPGIYSISLKVYEPGCTKDTTICVFVKIKGPQAMIKLPAPYKNNACQSGKKIPISDFEAAYSKCWNPNGDPVRFTTPQKVTKFVSRTDSFYCNAPIQSKDTVRKSGCTDSNIIKINYKLTRAQGATILYDSFQWFMNTWNPGDPYPWVQDPVKYKNVYYPPITSCNQKNMHDSDQYIANCKGPNLVFFPNNTQKYRLRYDIDNNAAGYTIPAGNDMSMDKCKNPSYPWGSDSLIYFWNFGDPYASSCTSTVSVPNSKCMYSTEITPYHMYSKSGCFTASLKATDTRMSCSNTATITILMEAPDAKWDYKIFKGMKAAGFDTSTRRLDWAQQMQISPSWGRRGLILNGTPCVGQSYPQRPSFSETLPSCDRQKWWMVFDSAASCSGYCTDASWADTNGDGINDKLIKTRAVQCGWVDDQTFAMMGNRWNYGNGGCKTLGLIIKSGDCIDTFWYHEYKYIADLQGNTNLLDPKSYNPTTRKYTKILDHPSGLYNNLCAPFQPIVTVADTQQVGITKFLYSLSLSFAAPWVQPWNTSIRDSCKWVQSYAYQLCHHDSFTIDPFTQDTTYTNCFIFPNPSLNCGVNQLGKATLQDFLNRGYIKRNKYNILDLRDTILLKDGNGNPLTQPGKYVINGILYNLYGCVNFFQEEMFLGHYTDFEADNQIVCKTKANTVTFKGTIRYFHERIFPSDPEISETEYWRDPVGARGGYTPKPPYVKEKVEWDLNGDGIYGDGNATITGRPDSVFYVYDKPGFYTVRMRTTDSNNCTQVLERKTFIQVMDVVADIATAQSVIACAPRTINFLDKSYGVNIYQYIYDKYGTIIDSTAVDSVVSWNWDFGDKLAAINKSSLKNPMHTYSRNGCYSVSLIVEMMNGCIDTIIKPDFICIQGPIPEFKVLDTAGCEPLVVFVKDKSLHLKTWEFIKGDNTVSNFKTRPADSIFAITYNTPGNYKLYLEASDSVYNISTKKWMICIAQYGEAGDLNDPHFNIHVYALPAKPTITITKDTLLTSSLATTYQWYKNGVKITGATQQTYIAKQDAHYKVQVSNTNGCYNFSDSVNILSILELGDQMKFEAYPNPFTSTFTIKAMLDHPENIGIRITNAQGKIIYKESLNASGSFEKLYDLKNKPAGSYYITISIGDKQGSVMIMKE